MRPPATRSTTAYYVVASLFALALVVGVLLFTLLVRGQGSTTFAVSTADATDCPTGEHAPVCFRFEVTNVGTRAGRVSCQVQATEGGFASFLRGETTYTSATKIEPQASIPIYAKVDAGNDATAAAPNVTCELAG